MSKEAAKEVASAINKHCCRDGTGSRYWKVVKEGYELVGGFEP